MTHRAKVGHCGMMREVGRARQWQVQISCKRHGDLSQETAVAALHEAHATGATASDVILQIAAISHPISIYLGRAVDHDRHLTVAGAVAVGIKRDQSVALRCLQWQVTLITHETTQVPSKKDQRAIPCTGLHSTNTEGANIEAGRTVKKKPPNLPIRRSGGGIAGWGSVICAVAF
jgi:hypothetical protein